MAFASDQFKQPLISGAQQWTFYLPLYIHNLHNASGQNYVKATTCMWLKVKERCGILNQAEIIEYI